MTVKKSKILCVGGKLEILEPVEGELALNGYEVIKAGNGQEALEIIGEQNIDLILSGIKIPEIDGLALCKRIKEDKRFKNIPVILITGHEAKDEQTRGMEAGADDFLSKPFDLTEIPAKIKRLLKEKAQKEKRIGELLIEMEFITEQQLQEALTVAKKRNIKVGEALYSMGALDKDHIYWVLSNQLKMDYIELSPEMVDQDLLKHFSIDLLEELICLPLYETAEEIHFAVAEPTDARIVEKVKGLRPEKVVHLSLALPEKINDVLQSFKRELSSQPGLIKDLPFEEKVLHPFPGKVVSLPHHSNMESVWGDFISILSSMSRGQIYWFYKTPEECRLLTQREGKFETLRAYSEETSLFIRNRLEQNIPSGKKEKEAHGFLRDKSEQRQGAFRLSQMDGFSQEIIKIEKIPTFSQKDFLLSYPQATASIDDLQNLFERHPRLLLGGPDPLFIKQCCYIALTDEKKMPVFPPTLFFEDERNIYYPNVAQVSKEQFSRVNLFKFFPGEMDFPIFYESEWGDGNSDEKLHSKILTQTVPNFILCLPFPSAETMEKALSERQDWQRAGFKALFLGPDEWKLI